ncbi:MAG TPA: putative sugar O-methyltransferase [Xanthobacteraceae bacterium]|jgi:putative sugar O-methyltransferase|nr:putative sugar O-methyltransferase [Xanthobacteraceae bacterium]
MASIVRTLERAINSQLGRVGFELRRSADSRARLTPRARFRTERTAGSDENIVADAKRHLEHANAVQCVLPDFGGQWKPYVDHIRAEIAKITDPVEALHFAQGTVNFDHRDDAGVSPLELYDRILAEEFPQFATLLAEMSENPHSVSQSLTVVGSRNVSNIFYWHARLLLSCLTHVGSCRRITEIGTGYGALARLWLNHPTEAPESYCLVDIPESLFFAECALRQEFGDRVGYFDGSDPGTPIVLVPICHLSTLNRKNDIVINTGSMQEMTDEWIDFYMNWLDHADSRFFYSANYAGQPLSRLDESRTYWGPRPSAKWSTRLLNSDIPLFKLQSPRPFLEAIYEKAPASGSLKDWSANRGMFVTLSVYLEGLDLLRQSLVPEDAHTFSRPLSTE